MYFIYINVSINNIKEAQFVFIAPIHYNSFIIDN